MTPRQRTVIFTGAAAALALPILSIASRMPAFGSHPNPYGDAINAVATAERHVTNMVSAVNFDYRGFDTLGEEFMLLCAVTGTVVLLRGHRGEATADHPVALTGRPIRPRDDATTLACRILAPALLLFGIYVALHAMTTPGGGFQGGVIIATAFLLSFLGDGYATWRGVVHSKILNACEGLGAALYGLCGFASIATGASFLTNVLPFGAAKDVFSGGLMLVENLGTTLAVSGGFLLLFIEFLEETRAPDPSRDA